MKKKIIILIFTIVFLVGTLYYSLGLFSGGGAKVSSLEKGLVAHYPLNGESETKDITPNANHGTNNGATLSTGRKGEANGSYVFDGNIPNSIYLGRPEVLNFIPQVDEFSISVWYKSTNKGILYSFGGSTGIRQIQLDFTEGNFEMYLGQNAGSQNVINSALTPNYKDGNWHHVGVVIPASSEGGKFYYDGNLVSSSLKIGSGTALNSAYIGARTDGKGYPLWGSVSDLRIYNRQITSDEIKLLYDSYKPEIATSDLNKGLVGHWMLDSENGAKDLTPNGNHGTGAGGITIGGTTDRKGRSGGATEFDGINDKMTIINNNPFNLLETTISFWTKFNPTKLTYFITFDLLGTSSRLPIIYYSSSGRGFGYWEGSNNYFGQDIQANVWYYITVVRKNNGFDLYINGNLERSILNSNSPFLFNNLYISPSNYLNGSISDVRIYNRALSEEEVKLLYEKGRS